MARNGTNVLNRCSDLYKNVGDFQNARRRFII